MQLIDVVAIRTRPFPWVVRQTFFKSSGIFSLIIFDEKNVAVIHKYRG